MNGWNKHDPKKLGHSGFGKLRGEASAVRDISDFLYSREESDSS